MTHRPLARPVLLLAAGAALLLAACGDDDATTQPTADGSGTSSGAPTVEIEQSRFGPEELTVSAGTTVEFVNLDPFDHTVTAAAEQPVSFDSGSLGQEETFEQTFEEPGSYDYFCQIHPTMRATVVVE